MREQAIEELHDRDATAESPECLRELEPDRAASQDEQPRRQLGEVEHGAVGQIRDRVQPFERRERRLASRRDNKPVGVHACVSDLKFMRPEEDRNPRTSTMPREVKRSSRSSRPISRTMLRCRSWTGLNARPGAMSRIPSLASRRASKTACAVSISDLEGTQP